MQRKDERNEMDELEGKEKSKTNRKEELKRKKDKKGGNEMSGLKRKEEVNEPDEHIETKGREVTK